MADVMASHSHEAYIGHLGVLSEEIILSSGESCSTNCRDSEDPSDVDVEVIVKHTFIEVIDPTLCRRSRSMSDSGIFSDSGSSKPWLSGQPWESIESEKQQDCSDVSTEDFDAGTRDSSVRGDNSMSDDDGVMDSGLNEYMSYQYTEQWWTPVSIETPTKSQLDASAAAFVPSWLQSSMTMDLPSNGEHLCWADQEDERLCWADQEDEADSLQQAWCYDSDLQDWRTTVMLRNMPNNYTRDMLLQLVDEMGFAGTYDFAYLPIDFSSQAGLGYAFINFISVEKAQLCFNLFEGFSNWSTPSDKVCTVTWSDPYQGLEAHIERYRNSPVMHHSIDDEWKPALFSNGERVAFPPPTKSIKTPKIRQPKKN